MDKWYVGVDPGQKGGLALISPDGKAVEYELMPDGPAGILKFLQNAYCASASDMVVVLEEGGARQGSLAYKSAGLYLGMFRMACCAEEIALHEVNPQKWKRAMGIKADKDTSIRVAKQLFPGINLLPTERCKKESDGMAEALLLAEYGRRLRL